MRTKNLLAATVAASLITAGVATEAVASTASNAAAARSGLARDGGGWGSGYGSTTAASASSSKGPTVKVAHSSAGSILVNAKGFTVYLFTADGKNSDKCVKVSGCTKAWPPLTVTGKPTAGTGVKASLLGTITISGGKKQVTYAGHPLYLYVGDSAPASTGYVGAQSFGGTWDAVSAAGTAVK